MLDVSSAQAGIQGSAGFGAWGQNRNSASKPGLTRTVAMMFCRNIELSGKNHTRNGQTNVTFTHSLSLL